MATNMNNNGNFNELVFQNRNKEYGAYVIRRSYNDSLSIAFLSAIFFFGILLLLTLLFTGNDDKTPDTKGQLVLADSLYTVPVDLTPVEKPKSEPEPPKENTSYKSDNLNFKADDKTEKDLVTTNDQAVITKDGTPTGKDSVKTSDIIKDPGTSTSSVSDKIEKVVDQMPDLPDMYKFISSNLTYPRMAVETGTSGTVYVTFVVEKDGSVSNVGVLKGIGDGCDQEAMRVVKMMPKWKPGLNHGEPVRVQFNLPIKFRLK